LIFNYGFRLFLILIDSAVQSCCLCFIFF